MSSPSWKTSLKQKTENLRQSNPVFRVAVVGIGHELNGDDAAGVAVARELSPLLATVDRLLVIDAGPAPENVTGSLRAFRPDLVLLVDAAQMNEEPGQILWLDWQETTGLSASTHTLPPYMLAQFLTAELSCEMALIGIQPFSNLFDEPLSLIVQQAVSEVVKGLAFTLLE